MAPELAKSFTVVCPDLRGFGQSSKLADQRDHAGSSKRAKAKDCIELMSQLGFEQFALVGHDRGSYTAYRAALDYPERITRLAVLDCIPILEALNRVMRSLHGSGLTGSSLLNQKSRSGQYLLILTSGMEGSLKQWEMKSTLSSEKLFMIQKLYMGCLKTIVPAFVSIKNMSSRIARKETLLCAQRFVYGRNMMIWNIYGDVLGIWKTWARDVRGKDDSQRSPYGRRKSKRSYG
ncbi:alpha/beta hydrolase [Pantoea sp. 9140]|uniref:alpha/beta fold hydrolase n=1 Tax=Pantoea sp. 9140 TaxID=1500896 RepID=UPI001EFB0624|nr:alpha/beta hydrolase [Pantoea sp. 9140]